MIYYGGPENGAAIPLALSVVIFNVPDGAYRFNMYVRRNQMRFTTPQLKRLINPICAAVVVAFQSAEFARVHV